MQYEGLNNVIVDSWYKIPAIAKMILDDGKTPVVLYKRPMTKKVFSENTSLFMTNTMIAIFALTMKS